MKKDMLILYFLIFSVVIVTTLFFLTPEDAEMDNLGLGEFLGDLEKTENLESNDGCASGDCEEEQISEASKTEVSNSIDSNSDDSTIDGPTEVVVQQNGIQQVSLGFDQEFIENNEQYGSTYVGDWTDLPNGKDYAKKDLSKIEFSDKVYSNYGPREDGFFYVGQNQDVTIKDIYYNLNWNVDKPGDVETTFIRIVDAKDVVLENLYIKQNGVDKGSYSVYINGCDSLVLKDSYFEGPISKSHIYVTNCKEIIIDGVEIAGKLVEDEVGVSGAYILGTGIFVDLGDKGEHPTVEPELVVIQNNYVHDFTYTPEYVVNPEVSRNYDAIAIRSPGNGIFFNNVIENWDSINSWSLSSSGEIIRSADAGLDLGHGRHEHKNYDDKLFRVERNLFIDTPVNKIAGYDSDDNKILLVNNIYDNSGWLDYFCDYSVYHAFETYLLDEDYVADQYFKINGCPNVRKAAGASAHGEIYQYNSLVVAEENSVNGFFTLGDYVDSKLDGIDVFNFDSNMYQSSDSLKKWLYSNNPGDIAHVSNFGEWNTLGQDVSSSYVSLGDSCFEDTSFDSLSLADDCGAKSAGDGVYLELFGGGGWEVSRDFYGNLRNMGEPSIGAVE